MPNSQLQVVAALVLLAVSAATPDAAATTRHYYVAAEDVVWDFAPSNQNLVHCMGTPTPCPIPAPWTTYHIWNKTRYIEYTDAAMVTPKAQPQWLGVLGPIIRAEEGDTVKVHFCNRSTRGSFGMHPHGFRYTKGNESAEYTGVNSGQTSGPDAKVPPGACFEYTWTADADSAPGPGDVSSKVWWYHSHVNEPAETNLGLLGPIIITKAGMAKADGSPNDVDREFVAAFFIFNEDKGKERGLMHSINGLFWGNLKGFVMNNGEKVRWHLLGMGNEVDLHSPHWHGKTVAIGTPARRTDVVELLPATMLTADMTADNPGEWMFHCHVADHIDAGMITTYEIRP